MEEFVSPGSISSWFFQRRNYSLAYCTVCPAAAIIRDHACPPTFLHNFSDCFALKYRTLLISWYCQISSLVHRPVRSQCLYRRCIQVAMFWLPFFFFTLSRYFCDALTSVDTSNRFSAWPGSVSERLALSVRPLKLKSMPIVEWSPSLLARARMNARSTCG